MDVYTLRGFSNSYVQLALPINLFKMPLKNIHLPYMLPTTFCPEIPGDSVLPGVTLIQEAQKLFHDMHRTLKILPFQGLGFGSLVLFLLLIYLHFGLKIGVGHVYRDKRWLGKKHYMWGRLPDGELPFAFNFLYDLPPTFFLASPLSCH